MIQLDQVLSVERAYTGAFGVSKKRVLQSLAERLAASLDGVGEVDLFDQLIARERLGSTGLGQGIAVPHCRLAQIDRPIAALAKLDEAVDFESPDRKPVDLLFVLVVPEAATDDHLNLLAAVVERFNDSGLVKSLRQATDSQTLYQHFIQGL
ncbi:PTS fructose transporter subunit IIA [Saccharospirillum sp. MSK14-1]|uniref:PTS sugar transporter subunit IIA n=1 Tax=Saccharospirillum sp. MSK14-1 TaxID=1897632 RepID=UPI000D36E17A|nr:PTS sugar transporter subunit IIA [Saccharospirillum sp. MSK14-1]PTY38883.1 PTS fructose transporter subunit IIA [Saccharospirillum sp. MSK14-1]